MKKILLFLLTIVSFTLPAKAYINEIFSEGDLNYSILDEEALTVSVSGLANAVATEITIPETVTYKSSTYTVTEIRSNAFNSSNITSISIPASVTTINNKAFAYCRELKTVEFDEGSNLSKICAGAFMSSGLTKIVIPKSVLTIESSAFERCSSLESVTFEKESELKLIDPQAFSESGITKIVIPSSVEQIGMYAFRDCSKLSSVTFEDNSKLNSIEYGAFCGISISHISFPASVTVIGQMAFSGCSQLQTVIFEEGSNLASLGESAFGSCGKLSTVILTSINPNIAIGNRAIPNNQDLTVYVLPTENYDIYEGLGLPSDKIKTLPLVTDPEIIFGDLKYTFIENTNNVSVIGLANENAIKISIPDNIFVYDTAAGTVNEYVVTAIGESAFANAKLESVRFEANSRITVLGDRSFMSTKIAEITIPASVVKIDPWAFISCRNLKTVKFEEGSHLETIASNAFYDTSIEKIVIPSSVNQISIGAFDGCRLLSIVILDCNDKVITVDTGVFPTNSDNLSIFVPEQVYPQYIENSKWSSYPLKPYTTQNETGFKVGDLNYSKVEESDSYVKVVGLANKSVTVITIPAQIYALESEDILAYDVTEIGDNAFKESSLESVSFESECKVIKIGEYAFSKTAITEITIPSSVTEIGWYAFSNCISLKSVTFDPESILKIIDLGTFDSCSIEAIRIPASVETIGMSAFNSCSKLNSVTFEENSSLTTIGMCAFVGAEISEIDIPSTVKSFGEEAFRKTHLSKIILPASIEEIGKSAFYCETLNSVIFTGAKAPSVGENVFPNNTELEVYVPYESFDDYEAVTALSSYDLQPYGIESDSRVRFADLYYSKIEGVENEVKVIGLANKDATAITIPEQIKVLESGEIQTYAVSEIGTYAFNSSGITNISIPSSVKIIGLNAFNCSKITKITIPASVTLIGDYAFANCSNLKAIEFEENSNLSSIGEGAFNRSALTDIEIPRSVSEIKKNAFQECGSLESVSFEKVSVLKSIGEQAFYNSALTEIEIPLSVEYINQYAFKDCSNLSSVTFEGKSNLTSIEYGAFFNIPITAISIPSSVTKLDDQAFFGCKQLQTVSFEEGSLLSFLGNHAFYNCESLSTVILTSTNPDIVIGNGAFPNNENLIVYVPSESLNAYKAIAQLESYNLQPYAIENESIINIGDLNYSKIDGEEHTVQVTGLANTSATAITIPSQIYVLESGEINTYDVTEIARVAFLSKDKLESVTFEHGSKINYIGVSSFVASGITDISIPASVEVIAMSAFNSCSQLSSVTFEENSSLTEIGSSAFAATDINQIEIPSTVTNIGEQAFLYTKLSKIILPSSVNTIGKKAFDCETLNSVIFTGAKAPSVGENVFPNNTELEVYVPSVSYDDYEAVTALSSFDLQPYGIESDSRVIFGDLKYSKFEDTDNTVKVTGFANEEATAISIPNQIKVLESGEINAYEVTEIGDNAFENCSDIESVKIPDSVITIGNSTFEGCSGLTFVEIPNSVTSIGNWAFYRCSGLTSVEMSELLTSIGQLAFKNTNLSKIILPASVENIGESAFECESLKTVVFTSTETIPSLGSDVFSSSIDGLFVPNYSLEAYQSGEGWSAYNDYVKPYLIHINGEGGDLKYSQLNESDFVTVVGLMHDDITEIIIPELINVFQNENISTYSVIEIGDDAFKDNQSLESLTIPATVVHIGKDAFAGCSELTSITSLATDPIPTLGENTFPYNDGLTINVPVSYEEAYIEKWPEYAEYIRIPLEALSFKEEKYELNLDDKLDLLQQLLINPENTTDEITWLSSDPKVAIVEDGIVTPLKVGEITITASFEEISTSCNVLTYLMGDANHDGVVNVADVIDVANYIVGNETSEVFVEKAAEMNGSDAITVTDAWLVADKALTWGLGDSDSDESESYRISKAPAAANMIVTDRGNSLTLALSDNGFTALQSDIILPAGVEVAEIVLGEGATESHTLMTASKGNVVRVMVFTMANEELAASMPVVELKLIGERSEDLGFTNVSASDASGQSVALGVEIDNVENGVGAIIDDAAIRLKLIHGGVIISGAEAKMIYIYTSDGKLVKAQKGESPEERIDLEAGLYLVKIANISQSVIVK